MKGFSESIRISRIAFAIRENRRDSREFANPKVLVPALSFTVSLILQALRIGRRLAITTVSE